MFKPFSTAYTRELINYQQNSQGLMLMAKADFFSLFWQAWVSSFTESLILRAFEATGLSPPNPNVVLKQFTTRDSESDVTSSDNSGKSLSSWFPMKRRLGNVVKDTADNRTKKLSQAIHHIICENQLLHQENEGLREAVAVKKKRTLKT
jgi:hypothetical protein